MRPSKANGTNPRALGTNPRAVVKSKALRQWIAKRGNAQQRWAIRKRLREAKLGQ